MTGTSASPRITAAMCAYGRVLGEPRLSPDGRHVAFVSTAMGRAQLVVAPVGGGAEVVVTSDPPPRSAASYGGGSFDWTPSGDALLYAAVDNGLWLVPAGGGPSRAVVAGGSLEGPAAAPAVSPDGARVCFVVDSRHVAVASLDPDGPWPVRLSTGADFAFDPVWSPDGSVVAWHEWDVPAMPWDSSRIVRRPSDATGPVEVVAGGEGVQTQQPRFSPDGRSLAFLCDAEGWLNLWIAGADGSAPRPLVKEEAEHGDPSWGMGQRSFAWSPDGTRIAFARNDRGFGSLEIVELATGATERVGKAVHGGLSWRADTIAAIRSGARTPTQIVAYGTTHVHPSTENVDQRTCVARGPVGGFEAAGLVEPEAVEWTADDGATVYGRLYRPEGAAHPPLILWVHGGPTGQWPVTFLPRVAFFVDRGWAVLLPDHRGSTGHGRAYTQAMRGGWGDVDVRDCAAGMHAAAERGWADPRRMVPMGGSAGGMTVLNLLARHPELCAAGVSLFGVGDLFELAETTHRFEAHYLDSVVGPLPDAAAKYRERSPLSVVDQITSPLLLLHGRADVVVPVAQSEEIARRLEARSRTVELHVYDGEGHGWNRPEIVMDELNRIASFVTRHVLVRGG